MKFNSTANRDIAEQSRRIEGDREEGMKHEVFSL